MSQTFMYSYNEMLLSNKKEWTTNTCNNMDEPKSMLSERSQIQNVTCCMILFLWNVQNRQNYRARNQFSDYVGLGVGVGLTANEHQETFWGEEMF